MKKSHPHVKESRTLLLLVVYFVALGIIFYYLRPGQLSWDILLISAIAWLAIEARGNRSRVSNALKIGLFLMVFDFIIENSGWISGLWQTHSSLAVGVVPIQVMGIALFGGAAWALYLPKKFRLWHSFADCVVFAAFGALGEWMMIRQGLFVYKLWWTSAFAFAAYFITWVILHFVRYRVFKD